MTTTPSVPFSFDNLPTIQLDPGNTVILVLKRSRLGSQRSLRSLLKLDPSLEGSVNKQLLSMVGKIYASAELKAIERFDADLTYQIAKLAFPSILRNGQAWVLPIALVPTVDARLEEGLGIRDRLVKTLLATFDARVAETRAALGPIADQFAWLTADRVGGFFGMSWRYYALSLPTTLESLDPLLYEREKARLIADLDEQKRIIVGALQKSALALMARLTENLELNEATGKPRRFYDEALSNVLKFLDLLPARQIVPDPEFTAMMDQARTVLGGVTPKAIKEPNGIAAVLREGIENITRGLEVLTGTERPRSRKIRFEDQEPGPVLAITDPGPSGPASIREDDFPLPYEEIDLDAFNSRNED